MAAMSLCTIILAGSPLPGSPAGEVEMPPEITIENPDGGTQEKEPEIAPQNDLPPELIKQD